MKKPVVLVTDRFSLNAQALLQQSCEVRFSREPQPTKEELREAQALVIRSRTKVDAQLLAAAPQLRLVVTATSGFDHICFSELKESQILVSHTPNANAASACELTFGLLLACTRRINEAHRAIKAGNWNREALIGSELSGKTWAIVGLGRIGSRVAKIANAFGMNVVAFDPFKDDNYFKENFATRVSFEEALKHADVMSFHVPATPDTKLMLHQRNLEFINRGVIVLNTSRGQVLDENDLCTAIEKGWVRAAGLDVFGREPLPRNSNLLNFTQIVLTPHIGGTTHEAFEKASTEAAEKVLKYFSEGSLSDRLPPEDAWYSTHFAQIV